MEFPPDQKSLGDFQGKEKEIEWVRLSELVEGPQLVEKTISPDDILQGNVGDCYLMSVLSSLAEMPTRIERLFLNSNPEKGIYSMLVKEDGIPREVVVDDYVPTYNRRPIFSKIQPGSREVWVAIIEKVWAKHCGSYRAIEEGYPHIVMDSFAQGPAFYFNLQDDHWPLFELACQYNHPMCLCSDTDIKIAELGLIKGHAYTVIDAARVDTVTGKRLVKLRNPWGQV